MENQEYSALDHLVNTLSRTGDTRYIGMLFPVHTRLIPEVYGLVEAMTRQAESGTSRNKIVNQLLEVGIQTTLAALPSDAVNSLHRLKNEILVPTIQAAVDDNKSKTTVQDKTWESGEL